MNLKDLWKLYQIYRKVSNMKNFFSKKLLAALVAAIIQVIGKQLGLSADQIAWITGIIVTYIIGQGIADVGKSKAIIETKAIGAAVELKKNDR
jgi:hypothetical protein